MKRIFSTDLPIKVLNTKFRENPSSANRTVPCGKTDRQTQRSNSCLSNAPEIHGISLLVLTPGYATYLPYRTYCTIGSERPVNRVQRPSIALTTRGNLNILKKVLHCGSATGCTANSTQSITGSSPVHQGEELTLSYVTHDHTEHVWMFVKRMLLGIKLCSVKDGRDGVVRV